MKLILSALLVGMVLVLGVSQAEAYEGGITLDDDTLENPSFVAPNVAVDTDLIFALVVNDGEFDSPQDTVTITIKDSTL